MNKKLINIGFIFTLIIGIGIQSCSSDYFEDDDFTQNSVTNQYNKNFASQINIEEENAEIRRLGWEKQLLFGMGKQDKIIGKNELILERYTYKGRLNKEIVKENIFDINNLYPIYDSINFFRLVPIDEVAEIESQFTISERIDALDKYIDSLYNSGAEVVILDWKYRNKKISTMALVSDKSEGVLYDNILSNIIITEFLETDARQIDKYIPRMKSGSEQGGNGSYKYVFDPIGARYSNFWGGTYAYVEIRATVYGDGGVRSIKDYSTQVLMGSQKPWSADGQIIVKSEQKGPNGYVDFIYAYYIARDAVCSITGGVSWGGFTVSVTSQSGNSFVDKRSDSKVINVSDLYQD